MEFPDDLRYTHDDEWVRVDGAEATIGITDYAQDQLGDIVYVEFVAAGTVLARGQSFGTVESVKAVSDLNSPVAGTVIAINDALPSAPDLPNHSPYGDGWMIRLRLAESEDLEGLLEAGDYAALRAHDD